MIHERISEALSNVDPKYISESAPALNNKKSSVWKMIIPIAAVFVIIAVLAVGVFTMANNASNYNESYQDGAVYTANGLKSDHPMLSGQFENQTGDIEHEGEETYGDPDGDPDGEPDAMIDPLRDGPLYPALFDFDNDQILEIKTFSQFNWTHPYCVSKYLMIDLPRGFIGRTGLYGQFDLFRYYFLDSGRVHYEFCWEDGSGLCFTVDQPAPGQQYVYTGVLPEEEPVTIDLSDAETELRHIAAGEQYCFSNLSIGRATYHYFWGTLYCVSLSLGERTVYVYGGNIARYTPADGTNSDRLSKILIYNGNTEFYIDVWIDDITWFIFNYDEYTDFVSENDLGDGFITYDSISDIGEFFYFWARDGLYEYVLADENGFMVRITYVSTEGYLSAMSAENTATLDKMTDDLRTMKKMVKTQNAYLKLGEVYYKYFDVGTSADGSYYCLTGIIVPIDEKTCVCISGYADYLGYYSINNQEQTVIAKLLDKSGAQAAAKSLCDMIAGK